MNELYLTDEQGFTPERQLDHAEVVRRLQQYGFEDVTIEDVSDLDDAFLMGYIAQLAIKRQRDPEAVYGRIGISVEQIDNTQ
ncbi:MAG TPA: hypothetical protein VFM68_00655 [Candidatus Saccharimonadales bacterium]|nr:hypothetical protein [Candidatus Saccharimonadales bacterium]